MEERATLAGTSQDGREMRRFWLMGGALLLTLLLGVLLAARPADASTRILIRCTVYDRNMEDPIFFTEHLHDHIGNTTTTNSSTGESLKAANTTSCDKDWFTSAGWFPVARDPGGRFVPLAPRNQVIVYYRNPGDAADLQPIPTGLGIFTNDIKIKSSGNRVTLTFPDCVNPTDLGVNKDLKKARMMSTRQGNCPTEYSYRIPRVSYVIRYSGTITSQTEVSAGVDEWAPYRTEMHADYLAANQDVFNNTLIDQCLRHGTASKDPACE
jgi:Domain of unknown function (DUF1996)